VRFQKRQAATADDSTSRATLPLGLGADCLRLLRGLARAESLEQIASPTVVSNWTIVLSQAEETLRHRPSDLKTLRNQCDLRSRSLLTPCPRLRRAEVHGA
jgi:hypothetical protein